MAFLQVKEVLPQLNSRSSLGRVIVNASGLQGGLTVRPSEKVVICCGRAYLSMERLQAHQRDGNCVKYNNMPPPPLPLRDPLGDCINELEDGRDNVSVPIINFVGSVRAEDIDDIDIFEEEPRALVDNSRLMRMPLSSTSSSSITRTNEPLASDYGETRRRMDDDNDNVEEDASVEIETVEDDPTTENNNSWQDVEEDEDGEEEEEEEMEYTNNNSIQSNNEWDELEEVEVYGGSEMMYERESKVHPSLHVQAAYSDTGASSSNTARTTVIQQGPSSGGQDNDGKFKCNFPSCIYSTVTEKNLRIHLQNAHDPTSPHVCGSCVCRYKSKAELTRHMKMFHGIYDQVLSVPEIIRVVINGRNCFKCKACGYTCRSEKPVNIHVHSAHDPNGKFRCPHCTCQYAKGNQLTQHIAMNHNKPAQTIFAPVASVPRPRPQQSATLYPPGPGGSGSGNAPPSPSKNVNIQLIKYTTETGATVEVKKVVSNNWTKYECKFCAYTTPKKSAIICHAKGAHVASGKFQCPYCTCCYATRAPYHAHLTRSHPDKSKKSSNQKKTKVAATPTPSTNYKSASPQSSPSFGESSPLSDNDLPVPPAPPDSYKLVMINKKALFKCEACGFMARDLIHTSRHIHNSHGPSTKYPCRHCIFRFSHHASLALHMTRVHPECIERTEETEEPRMELLIADGFKIFRCKLCLYVIPIEAKCLSHVINSHRPEGEYQCDLCSCRFMLPGPLSTHKSLFHRNFEPVSSPKPVVPRKSKSATASSSSSTVKASPLKIQSPTSGFVGYSIKFVRGKRWFFCNGCEHSTEKENNMKAHVTAAHNPDNPFKCNQCSCRYAHKGRLTSHVATKHNKDFIMPVLSPKIPIPSSHNDTFQCDKCMYTCTDESSMETHKNLHSQSNMYPCTICSCQFPSNDMLLLHLSADHNNAGSSTTSTSGKRSTYNSAAAAAASNPITPRLNPPVGYNQIVRDGRVSYKCTHSGCTYVVESSAHIRLHVESAHPDQSFRCGRCTCRFETQGRLNKHMKEYHHVVDAISSPTASLQQTNADKINVLKCQIIGCGFETQPQYEAELDDHMANAHNPKAKHKCDKCPCRYNSKASLLQHENWHHGEEEDEEDAQQQQQGQESEASTDLTSSPIGQNFQCKFCEFSTKNRGGFITHLTASHSAKNPHQCSKCSCRFASAGGLTSHEYKAHNKKNLTKPSLKTHTGLLGRIKAKAASSNLKSKKLQQKELPPPPPATIIATTTLAKHSCTLCSSSFNNNSSLNWHMIRVHTQRNPNKPTFLCGTCGYNYDTEKGLLLHQKKAHKKMGSSTNNSPRRGVNHHKEIPAAAGSEAQLQQEDDSIPDAAQQPNALKSRSAIAKAARKYAEIEGPNDLPSDSDVEDENLLDRTAESASESQPTTDDNNVPAKATNRSSKRQCSKCSYTGDFYLVTTHEERAHVENGHQCSYCVCSYKSLSSLRKHMSFQHKQRGEVNKNFTTTTTNHLHNTRSSITPVVDDQQSLIAEEQEQEDPVAKIQEKENDNEENNSSPDDSESQNPSKVSIHQCPLCSFTCRLPVNLKIHELSAHVKGGYLCKYCSCSYRTTFGLDSHLKLRHKKHISIGQALTPNAIPSTSVKVENGEFEAEDYNSQQQDDQQLVSSGLLRCTKCSFSTKLHINLASHMKTAHLGNHHCTKCNRSFLTEPILDKHNFDVHKERAVPMLLQDNDDDDDEEEDDDDDDGDEELDPDSSQVTEAFSCLKCDKCPFTTLLRIKLKQHKKKHEQDEANGSAAVVADENETGVASDPDHEVDDEDEEEEQLDENSSKKRKKSVHDEGTLQNNEPKVKRRKLLGRTSVPPNATIDNPIDQRRNSRRSAEVARKVINSVMQSEQFSEEDEEMQYKNVEGEGNDNNNDGADAASEPKRKKSRLESTIHDQEEEDVEALNDSAGTNNNSTSHKTSEEITKEADEAVVPPRPVQISKTRQSLKEVATLQRATDRVALNVRNSKESSKRAAGLREFKKLTCSRCAISFDTIMKLTNHYQRCEEKPGDFLCRLCDSKYVSLLKLKEHIWKNHMLEEDKQKSETTASTKSPLGHPYTCSLCKVGIKEHKSYILHISVPHLFRCKKCVYVCGTKTAMDIHKRSEHRKAGSSSAAPFQDVVVNNDDIRVIYDSAAPTNSALGTKSPEHSTPEKKKTEATTTEEEELTDDEDNNDDDDEEKVEEKVEVEEPPESLICVECGHFSETLEEAREHNEAVLNIESLICDICGDMADSGCESVLHIKSHQDAQDEEDGDDTVDDAVEQDGVHDFTMQEDETPAYIEFEFTQGDLQNSGLDTVEVPLVTESDGSALDPVILFQLKDLESN